MLALLIDDHALFRESVALLVAHRLSELELLLAADIGAGLQVLAQRPECALVLLDLGLPDSRGMAGLERVRAAAPTRPVIVISADERAQTVHDALDRGAAGFIPKTADSGVFCEALRRVLDGRVALPAQLAPPLALRDADAQHGLSPRQCEVLRLLIEGRSNKDIQRELALSESTVKTHLQAVFRRLDVNTRTQAVVAAARLGLRFGGYRG
jgi:DNA-binding NarL/FixJ family response regulator